jgi:NTP pyrophosphatase (non-canonical NTP hydrolase)
MRTLATQMMLRRLIRVHGESVRRLRSEPLERDLPEALRARLLELVGAVRQAWAREAAAASSGGAELLDRHVRRSLSAVEAAVAVIGAPIQDLQRIEAEFNQAALPLVFFLRGLESTSQTAALAELSA